MPASLGLRAFNVNGATTSDPDAENDDFYLVHFCQGKLAPFLFLANNKLCSLVAALVITLYDHRELAFLIPF